MRWLIYFYERLPLLTGVLCAAGISLSGMYLGHGKISLIPFLLSLVGILLVFCFQRLIDDVRDYKKDCLAHPERPLPRRLIKKEEALTAMNVLQIALFAYGLIIWVFSQSIAALAYVIIALYLWLLNQDAFLKKWLRKRFLRGIAQQLILVPIAIFSVAIVRPYAALSPSSLTLGFLLVGAFLTDDVCSKLNPKSHPILGSYIHFFGFFKSFEFVVGALALSAICAFALGVDYILLPCQATVLVALVILFFEQGYYRLPQIAARLSLLVHAWAIIINQMSRGPLF